MTLSTPWSRRLLRLVVPSARSLRMAAYSGFTFGVLALASARVVRADMREVGLGMGHQLAKLEDLTGSAYVVTVNGTTVHRSSARTAQPVSEVLGRYESYCRDNAGALGRAMRDIPAALADRIELPDSSIARASVLRDEHDGRGMVVCFVDEPGVAPGSLADRLREVSTTGDLSKLGHFRYAFAEPGRHGTHVVTFWSDGEVNLKKMFPADGDAPGTDSVLAPRPVGSRRTLSAAVEGYPAAVRIYESAAPRSTIERDVDTGLRKAGFALGKAHDHGAAYLRKDGAEVFVSYTDAGNRTAITYVESGAASLAGIRVEDGR